MTTEQAICGEFWGWLYAERARRGQNPSDAEQMAHPAFVALRAFRSHFYGDAK